MVEKIKSFLQISPEFNERIPDDFNETSSLLGLGILDSFSIITLVVFIEENFGIRVEGDELIPEHFDSLSTIEQYIKKKIENR